MNHFAAVVLVLTLGVDVGWQPLEDGELEYVVQIEPDLWELMRDGEEITSELPPDIRGVRRYRIKVGTEPLIRNMGERKTSETEEAMANSSHPPGLRHVLAQRPPMQPGVLGKQKPGTPLANDQAEQQRGEVNLAAVSEEEKGENRAANGENVGESNEPSGKPWFPFTLAVVMLMISASGNIYQLLIYRGLRRQHVELLAEANDFVVRPSHEKKKKSPNHARDAVIMEQAEE